jgi:hypothetical protein
MVVIVIGIFRFYFRFMSYSTFSNWCQILKLLSNFGCLYTVFYLDGANSIKNDWHICNLLMDWPDCKSQVCNLVLI